MSKAQTIEPTDLSTLFGIPFTEEQLAAITCPHEPTVVIAGAGSGKTTLMSARVVWLVATGQVTPDGVLGLTFTNKAAAELGRRVRSALQLLQFSGFELPDGEPTISTYHAYAASLIREYGVWAGFEPAASLLTDAQRTVLAERVSRRAPGPFPALRGRLDSLTAQVLALEAEMNEHLVSFDELREHDEGLVAMLDRLEVANGKLTAAPADARLTAKARLELLPVVEAFRGEKRARNAVDFGDQMASAAVLAERVAEVANGERSRFGTVLLDEYQDTSMAQQRLLLALFGSGHPVLAVGDPFQSIYGWRGASVRNILTFASDFKDEGRAARVFPLGQNNRSDGQVLNVANLIGEPLRARFPDVVPLRPAPGRDANGEVCAALYETASDEVEAIADDIAATVEAGVRPNDIAILCRESKVFGDFVAALTGRGIPVDVVGLTGLLDLPEVVEVLAVLEVLYDPTANPSLVRLLAGPRWRVGPVDLAQLGIRARQLSGGSSRHRRGYTDGADGADGADDTVPTLSDVLRSAVEGMDPAENVSLAEALEDPGQRPYSDEARERFAAFAAELGGLRKVLHETPDVVLSRIIATIGIDVELMTLGSGTQHLEALLEHARAFTASGGGAGAGPFLAYVALARRYRIQMEIPTAARGNGVSLLTVHKAKGLEWNTVYVPQVCEGIFPSGRSRSTPLTSPAVLPYDLRGDALDFPNIATYEGNQGIERFKAEVAERERAEDRRLAYVAFTRAAHRLVVSGHRWGTTQKKARGVSDYLQATADYCSSTGLEVRQTLKVWAPEPPDGSTNPLLSNLVEAHWPSTGNPALLRGRRTGGQLVRKHLAKAPASPMLPGLAVLPAVLDANERNQLRQWDADIDVLLGEVHQRSRAVDHLPQVMSASGIVQVLRNPKAATERRQRPLPVSPAPAAYRGTRFHEWVEARFGQVPLIDIDGVLPETPLDAGLASMQQAFLAGPYADRRPVAVEAPFQMVLGGQLVSGRIDAVYEVDSANGHERYEVVDWKTGHHEADALQLALYRLAWAELNGLDVTEVAATFYYVATGEVVQPGGLPDREALTERWLASTYAQQV